MTMPTAEMKPTPSAYPDQKWNGRERHFDPQNLDYPPERFLGKDEVAESRTIAHALVQPVPVPTAPAVRKVAKGRGVKARIAAERAKGTTGQTTRPPLWDANQGPRGWCTLFSLLLGLVWGGKHPRLLKVLLGPRLEEFVTKGFAVIQSFDRAMGNNWSDGASMLAMAKFAKAMGWVRAYYWDYSLAGFVAAQRAKKTVLTGIDWVEGFDNPDPVWAVIQWWGAVLGGHSIFWPYLVLAERAAIPAQTWGRVNYGDKGIARCPMPSLAQAIAAQGEVLLLDEVEDADPDALWSFAA